MSKAALIERVAKKGKLSKAEAGRTVDLVLGEIEAGLKASKKEGRYTVGTFGTFTIGKRAARKGRNPQTGEAIRIKASKVLKFKPAAQLKAAAGIK
jgi:DNA-binding protein HU-beta